MGPFWEPGEVIFLCFFGCVFWTTPGATPDGQSGAPGVLATDRGSIDEDNFGWQGRCGGVGGVQPNNQRPTSSRMTERALKALASASVVASQGRRPEQSEEGVRVGKGWRSDP